MTEESQVPDLSAQGPASSPPSQVYVHGAVPMNVVAQLVDDAFASAARWWNVIDAIRTAAQSVGLKADEPVVRELIFAASYDLHLTSLGEPGDCVLRPQSGEGARAFPPEISDVAAD